MSRQEDELVAVLGLLDGLGCLRDVVLVGSWVELFYERGHVLGDFEARIQTRNIDFLVRNQRRPSPPVNLTASAKEVGYSVVSDRLTQATKLWTQSGLEIEFLIAKAGAGLESTLKTNLGVTAQSLWHLDVLKRHLITIDYAGHSFNVPSPEAYVVHKMIINHERGKKRDKDARSVLRLWPHLNKDELSEIISSSTKKERKHIEAFMSDHSLACESEGNRKTMDGTAELPNLPTSAEPASPIDQIQWPCANMEPEPDLAAPSGDPR